MPSTVLRCVANSSIPCNAAELGATGKMPLSVTVLQVAHVGFATVPCQRTAAGYKKMQNTKPLFEEVKADGTITAVIMYGFKKATCCVGKGDRDDSTSSTLHVGQTLAFWAHRYMFDDMDIFPADAIRPFSIVDVMIAPTNTGQSVGGYGIQLKKICMHPTSLYSYVTNALCSSLEQESLLACSRQLESPFIQRQLETKNITFFGKPPVNTFVSVTMVRGETHRLFGPAGAEIFPGVPCVDISTSDLLRFTNETDIDAAITLIDFASAASALYLYVVSSRQGGFSGVPLIDAAELLKPVRLEFSTNDLQTQQVQFQFPHEIIGVETALAITVKTNPVENAAGPPAPCQDFPITSESFSLTKGFGIAIGTQEDPEILRFCFNVTLELRLTPLGIPLRLAYASRKRRMSFDSAGAVPS